MKKLAMYAAAALAVASMQFSTQANAAEGFLCGFVSVVDNFGEDGAQTGEIDGGPISPADLDAPPGNPTGTIEIICTIQVGPTGETHAGPDAASESSGASQAVAVLPPTELNYVAPAGSNVYLCSEVVVDGTRLYYHDADTTADPADVSGFSSSNGASCSLSISQEVCEPGLVDPNDPFCL